MTHFLSEIDFQKSFVNRDSDSPGECLKVHLKSTEYIDSSGVWGICLDAYVLAITNLVIPFWQLEEALPSISERISNLTTEYLENHIGLASTLYFGKEALDPSAIALPLDLPSIGLLSKATSEPEVRPLSKYIHPKILCPLVALHFIERSCKMHVEGNHLESLDELSASFEWLHMAKVSTQASNNARQKNDKSESLKQHCLKKFVEGRYSSAAHGAKFIRSKLSQEEQNLISEDTLKRYISSQTRRPTSDLKSINEIEALERHIKNLKLT